MSQIALEIPGRIADLGGFTVTRLLPYVRKRTVGPFIFVDHMGPFRFAPGAGMVAVCGVTPVSKSRQKHL